MNFAPKQESLIDVSSADSSIEMYPDGTPVRRNKVGKRLVHLVGSGGSVDG
jgi:hypothetical protein